MKYSMDVATRRGKRILKVTDRKGNVVFDLEGEEIDEFMELGLLKDLTDEEGMHQYLVDMGIIRRRDTVQYKENVMRKERAKMKESWSEREAIEHTMEAFGLGKDTIVGAVFGKDQNYSIAALYSPSHDMWYASDPNTGQMWEAKSIRALRLEVEKDVYGDNFSVDYQEGFNRKKRAKMKEVGNLSGRGTFKYTDDEGNVWSQIELDGDTVYVTPIDNSHFKTTRSLSNTDRAFVSNVGQYQQDREFYTALVNWLRGKADIAGRSFMLEKVSKTKASKVQEDTITLSENMYIESEEGTYVLEVGDKIRVKESINVAEEPYYSYAASAFVNDDWSGVEDDEEEAYKAFLNWVETQYGPSARIVDADFDRLDDFGRLPAYMPRVVNLGAGELVPYIIHY